MKDTLSALPEFQEMKQKFSLHINICQECKEKFETRNLTAIATIEQDLATGETSDGKPVKPAMIVQALVPILYDQKVSNLEKMRLLMLYIICQEGISDVDRRKLLEYAKLNPEECQGITNLSLLGLRLIPLDAKEKKAAQLLKGPYTYKGKKNRSNEAYDLSRYVPLLKTVIEDCIAEALGAQYFPFTIEPASENTSRSSNAASKPTTGLLTATGDNPYSLRTLRATWTAPKSKKKEDKPGSDAESSLLGEYRKNGARVIVFVIGGISYSEMRSVYEIMKDSHREVVIGSTHIFNPTLFVDSLKDLSNSESRLSEVVKEVSIAAAPDLPEKGKEKRGIFGKK